MLPAGWYGGLLTGSLVLGVALFFHAYPFRALAIGYLLVRASLAALLFSLFRSYQRGVREELRRSLHHPEFCSDAADLSRGGVLLGEAAAGILASGVSLESDGVHHRRASATGYSAWPIRIPGWPSVFSFHSFARHGALLLPGGFFTDRQRPPGLVGSSQERLITSGCILSVKCATIGSK
jgi:hypothetical protein